MQGVWSYTSKWGWEDPIRENNVINWDSLHLIMLTTIYVLLKLRNDMLWYTWKHYQMIQCYSMNLKNNLLTK